MRIRQYLILVLMAFVLAACDSADGPEQTLPEPPPPSPTPTQALTVIYDPTSGVIPLPNNFLIGADDLTLNIPFDPSSSVAGTFRALNALDGWGTISPWSVGVTGSLDASTVIGGSTVHWFEVSLTGPGGAVTGIISELTPGIDYVATISTTNPAENSVVFVPLRPLKEITSYLAVITSGVRDTSGNFAAAGQFYSITKYPTPLVDDNGNSNFALLDDALAASLEPARQLTNASEAAAASVGVNRASIVTSWVATTQSITPVMGAVRSTASAQFSQLAPTGLNTGALGLGLPGIADIYIGVLNVPYYLEAPTADNPLGPLTGNWEAAPGAYQPPFDQLGFDPDSTHLTFLNPFPVTKSMEVIPVLLTVPNAGSGQTMPASGWPSVIFQHGITGNRTNMLALADSMALAGFAVISIDLPLHGIASTVDPATGVVTGPEANPFYIENTPFGALANERTFDVDYINNLTGAPGPDGFIDASGSHTINLASLLTGRDNNRQAVADLSILALSIPTMDIDGDGVPDFDGASIRFVGHSLGGIIGAVFLAIEPTVSVGTLSAPGGGLVGLLLGSNTFGSRILAGLAALGIVPGDPLFDLFTVAAQTVFDSSDPINFGALAAATNAILLQEIVGSDTSLPDQVVPNSVPGFPLSGTDPLIAVMGLASISQTTQDPAGIRGVTRFVVGGHSSILSPAASLIATVEMQGEAISMAASGGTVVQVTNPTALLGN